MRTQLFRALAKASSERTRRGAPKLVARAAPAKKPAASEIAKTIWRTETNNSASKNAADAPLKPQPVAQTAPAPPSAPAPSGAPDVKSPETANSAPTPDIDVVKVRPVAITTQRSPASTPLEIGSSPPAAAAPVTPKLDLQALRDAISAEASGGAAPNASSAPAGSPASIEDIISSTTPPAHSPFAQKLALASDAPAGISGQPGMGLGRQPSTLDAQAAAIGPPLDPRPTAAVAASLNPSPQAAPARFAAVPVGSGYEIQIGAYSTAEEAESRMATARSKAAGLLEGHKSMALPVQKSDRKIFRARFAGFNEDAAESACLELRRLAIDCFVMKAE
jgi:D-alanyl-D-alanine carboxypeptidase